MTRLRQLIEHPASGGLLLLLATLAALLFANSPWQSLYHQLVELPLGFSLGTLSIEKSLVHWVGDALMAVFFFHVGLELKRELLAGELSAPAKVALPLVAAIGGVVVPALIYVAFNATDPVNLHGWAIPTATDIAFVLGVLSVFGKRVPTGLKAFLVSLAIFDDIGAILIIAVFYSGGLAWTALGVAAVCLILLTLLNRCGVRKLLPYLLVGVVLWAAVLQSGIHATIAGVLLALFIPFGETPQKATPSALDKVASLSLLERLEHSLAAPVTFFILPVFAFTNAGLSFLGMPAAALFEAVPLGIMLGLLLGKPVGIMGASYLMVKCRLAPLPGNTDWRQMFAGSVLCGIGFTMSLFIAGLAFAAAGGHGEVAAAPKLGILLGSVLAAVVGYLLLRVSLPKTAD